MDKITKIVENLTLEERKKKIKDFLGLSPEQSFQDIDIESTDEIINTEKINKMGG